MPTLKKYDPKNEKELHSIIEKEIDSLEEGLIILKYEFTLAKGTPDFSCVDSGGRLVIIEVKCKEDENIVFQALRYYSEIDQKRYIIAKMFSNKKIDPEAHPRVILIARDFSDDIRRLSTLVIPEIELFEYTILKTQDNKEGICFHPVSLPKYEEPPSKSKSIEEIKGYMTKDSLKPVFEKILGRIKAIGDGIEDYTTESYVGFKYRGRQIAYLSPHRKSFDIGFPNIDEDGSTSYEYQRIESGNEDYSETLEKILKTLKNISTNKKE
jgi:hypothetical protein